MAENEQQKFLELIRKKAALKLLFLPHAVRQMNRPDRMIAPAEVKKTVLEGVIIEEYPEDVRGHSCLMLEFCDGGRPVHVVCAPKEDYTKFASKPEKGWKKTAAISTRYLSLRKECS